MGFSVPLDFHKKEEDCHLVRFKAVSKDDALHLATVIYTPGERTAIFEQGQIIKDKTEFDADGEFSALVSGLILCLENNIKTIFIEGVCDKIRNADGEMGEFINNLFSQFTYVYFKGELADTADLDRVIGKVSETDQYYYQSGPTP
jgi:hypothetical protein